jgi:N-acetylneuraminic acid mutarotase
MKTLVLFSIFFFTVMLSQGQWSYTDLTESKFRIGVTSLGTKAYFAGGESNSGQVSAVEIYDVEIEDWDTVINLFMPRSHIACVSCGTKVFFAGGIDFQTFAFYDIIEIWDTETGQWSFEQLSAPRFGISAVSHGNEILFAGGVNFILGQAYDIVEIYNIDTEEWSYDTLSLPRSSMGAAVVGDLAFFAGGADMQGNMTNRVDIYNFTTNTWSIDSLSQARTFLTATAVGTKVLFAGGTTPENESSARVDIYDTESGEWSIAELSQPRAFWEGNSGTVCDRKAYFVGGAIFDLNTNSYGYPYNTIDIYDLDEDEWSTDTTITPVLAHAVIGIDNHLLIAGGDTYNGLTSTVQIFTGDTCITTGVEARPAVSSQQSTVNSFPNPFNSFTTIEYQLEKAGIVTLKIFNNIGQQMAVLVDGEQAAGSQQMRWNAEGLPAGIYYYRLSTDDCRLMTGKVVKY